MEEPAQFDGLRDDPLHQRIEAVTAEHDRRLNRQLWVEDFAER
jgi:hypothetical protein